MAYYQWYTGMRFYDMIDYGLTITNVMKMYILHEADPMKFVDHANDIIERNKKNKMSRLKQIRISCGYTQKELSDASGVKLRMIQLYEQKQNNINIAAVSTIRMLAYALHCNIEDILE